MNRKGVAVGAIILGALGCFVMVASDQGAFGLLFLGLVAWGVYAFVQASKSTKQGMKQVYRPESSYTVEEQSDGQLRFNVLVASQRSGAPIAAIFVGIMVTAIVGVIAMVMIALHGSPFLLLLSPMAGIGVAVAILQSRKDGREHAFDTRIYVSGSAINYPDPAKDFALTMVMTSTIDRLRIEQSIANTSLVQFAGPGNPLQNHGVRMKSQWMNWMADHSYVLEVHSQGKRHVLAGGMNEITAHGLMQAISRKIGI